MQTDFEQLVTRALSEGMRPEQKAALDQRLAHLVRAHPGEPRRLRSRPKRLLVLLVALLALAVPVAAAGVDDIGRLLTRLVSGPAFQTEIDTAIAEVPLPEGRDWPDVGALNPATLRGPYEGDPPGDFDYYETGPGAALSVVESIAACIWFDEWLSAQDAGDVDRRQAAAAVIAEIPTWESWQSPYWDKSYTDLLATVIAGVAANDVGPVRSFSDLNCAMP